MNASSSTSTHHLMKSFDLISIILKVRNLVATVVLTVYYTVFSKNLSGRNHTVCVVYTALYILKWRIFNEDKYLFGQLIPLTIDLYYSIKIYFYVLLIQFVGLISSTNKMMMMLIYTFSIIHHLYIFKKKWWKDTWNRYFEIDLFQKLDFHIWCNHIYYWIKKN